MKRVLFYNINGQVLSEKPDGDYSNIVKGTKNYLYASFDFDKSWNGLYQVLEASNEYDFKNSDAVAIKNNVAMIPNSITDKKEIYIRVHGQNKLNQQICTNAIMIKQKGV